jgi:hypothetical protein
MCARRRTHLLLCRQKKVGQEKATPSLRPFASLRATCGARNWGGADELPALPLRGSSGQTASASQSTKCMCPSAHAPTPAPALLGAASRGGERGQKRLLLSQLRRVSVTRCALPTRPKRSEAAGAERSNGPCGARSHPLLTVPRSAGPGVGACRRTRASWSGSSLLSERSSKNEASSATPPQDRASQVARSAAKGHGLWGAVSLPTFFLRKKKVGAPPGAHPGSRPWQKHAASTASTGSTAIGRYILK